MLIGEQSLPIIRSCLVEPKENADVQTFSTFRRQEATVTCERQLLASTHVPTNLVLISRQATGVVSPQSSAFKESAWGCIKSSVVSVSISITVIHKSHMQTKLAKCSQTMLEACSVSDVYLK